jgi:surface antigen
VRNSQRRLPYAVSTVLGLAAPALAAMILTASTPGLAAMVPPPADRVWDPGLHIPSFRAAAQAPVVHKTVAKPVVKPTATRPVAHRATVRTTVTATKPVAQPVRRTTTTSTTSTRTATSSTAQPWGTDDYPYKSQTDFYAMDKWGFTERQCVSFAAWRLAQHGHAINNSDNWGSAYTWDEAARRLGFGVTSRAHVGAVAQWNAHESGPYYSKGSATANGKFVAGGYGHVGWVKAVYSDGSALVEQYNMGSDRSYSVMRVKAPRYLLVG